MLLQLRALKLACADVPEGSLPVHRTMVVSVHMHELVAMRVHSAVCSTAVLGSLCCMLLPALALKFSASNT